MTKEVFVRPVQRRDYDQWLGLWNGYNEFYGRVGPTALPESITRTTWERFFDAYEPVNALVAELDGTLAGLAHYIFHRNTIMLEPTCYLQDLFTDKAKRGSGIGRTLVEALYAHARDAGLSSVYWHTHQSNETAMKLYDRVANNSEFLVFRKSL